MWRKAEGGAVDEEEVGAMNKDGGTVEDEEGGTMDAVVEGVAP